MSENKKILVKDTFKNTISNVFVKALTFLQGIVVANILGPTMYGLKNAIQLISDYGSNIHLGIIFQHNAERSENEYKKPEFANKVSNVTFTFILYLGLFCLLISWISFLLPYSSTTNWSIFLILLNIPVMLFVFFYKSILTSQTKFGILAKINILQGISLIVFVVPLTYFWSIPGFFLGILLSTILTIIIEFIFGYQKFEYYWNKQIFIHLLKFGILQMILQIFWIVLYSIDRIFVLNFFGKTELGFYALGLFFSGLVSFVLNLIWNPITPRVYQNIDNKTELYNYVIKSNQILFGLLSWFVIICVILLPFFILFMPSYATAIFYTQILVFSTIFIPNIIYQYFIGRKKMWTIIIVELIFLAVAGILNYLAVIFGFGTIGIVFATLITMFLYGNLMNYLCYSEIVESKYKSIIEMLNYLWPLGYALIGYGLLWLLAHYWLYSFINYYVVKIIQAVLFTIWYSPILWKIEKEHRILKIILDYLRGKIKGSKQSNVLGSDIQ